MTTEQALEWLQVGHQKFIATDSDGKVVGKVEQRVLDLRWDVSTDKEHLGEYLTLEHGKAAVEKAHQPAAAQLAGWISVEDRLPDTEDEVLVATKHGVMLDRWRMQAESPLGYGPTIETGMYWDDHEFEDVSYWMPIQPPPTQPKEPSNG